MYRYEYTGFTRGTGKRLQAPYGHGKLETRLANTSNTEGGKYDRNVTRTAYIGGSSSKAQALQIYCDTAYPHWTNRICQGWQSLQSKTRSIRALHSPEHEADRQIKKASDWRQWTTSKFLVFRTSHSRSAKLMRDGPRYLIPTFSIARVPNKVNGCMNGVCDGKRVYP